MVRCRASVVIGLQSTGEAAGKSANTRKSTQSSVSVCQEILMNFVTTHFENSLEYWVGKIELLNLPQNVMDRLTSELEKGDEHGRKKKKIKVAQVACFGQ